MKQTASILELTFYTAGALISAYMLVFQPFQSALKVNLGTRMHVWEKQNKKTIDRDTLSNLFSTASKFLIL